MSIDASEQAKTPRRYRGLDPEERRADRRRRLIDAGVELYGTVGYQATTITALCREAGITTQHFYDEFGSQEKLLAAVFDETATRAAVQVADALDGASLDLESQSRAGLGAFLHSMLDDPRGARILCLEVVGVSAEFESRRREVLRDYADVVARSSATIQLEHGRQSRPTSFIPLALVAGVNDAMVEWLHLDDKPTIDDIVEELVELFVLVGTHFAIEPERTGG